MLHLLYKLLYNAVIVPLQHRSRYILQYQTKRGLITDYMPTIIVEAVVAINLVAIVAEVVVVFLVQVLNLLVVQDLLHPLAAEAEVADLEADNNISN